MYFPPMIKLRLESAEVIPITNGDGVICKNCESYSDEPSINFYPLCMHKLNRTSTEVKDFVKGHTTEVTYTLCKWGNPNGNCPLYKKKYDDPPTKRKKWYR